jgi:hypothetical protein
MTGWRKRTIMEMAREAGFEGCAELTWENVICTEELEAFAKLVREDERELCAQVLAVQEPVGKYTGETRDGSIISLYDEIPVGTLLYTTPPQRTWVRLSDTQIENVYYEMTKLHRGAPMPWGQIQFGKALQEKFIEVNT